MHTDCCNNHQKKILIHTVKITILDSALLFYPGAGSVKGLPRSINFLGYCLIDDYVSLNDQALLTPFWLSVHQQ
ncbi:hypothetical protein ABTF83_19720, partial [Acinetobacter baumannii]